jgi:LysR family glycine cleavage system transcriptional activator
LLELDLSAGRRISAPAGSTLAIRNGHGRLARAACRSKLMPSIFMPLCAPALKAAAAVSPIRANATRTVPLLGRPDWWALVVSCARRGPKGRPSRFGTSLAAEHLDVAAALAGHGIAIASPILFRGEIDAGRLVPAHDLVASDGRAFWLTYPVARQRSRKIVSFRDWFCDEAADACAAGADFIRRAVDPQAE